MIKTDRLILRPPTIEDTIHFYHLNSDPEVMRYLGNEFSTMEEAREVVPKIIARNAVHDHKLGIFIGELLDCSNCIGWFLLRPKPLEQTKVLEIGYRLKKKYWGKGFGTEGARALMHYGRTNFSPDKVFATAMEKNHASVNTMKKIGLVFEKTFVEPGYENSGEFDVMYSWSPDNDRS